MKICLICVRRLWIRIV